MHVCEYYLVYVQVSTLREYSKLLEKEYLIILSDYILFLCTLVYNSQDYILDSEELAPSNFVKKYQDEFPLKVRVCKGFYGHSERTSVSEGDSFNIHFVKHTKVGKLFFAATCSVKIKHNIILECYNFSHIT